MNKPEADLQIQIADLLRVYEKMRRLVFFAVSNELFGKIKSGAGLAKMALFKRMGLRPGVSDLVILFMGRAYLLEVKDEAGRLSDKQKEFRDDVIAAGCEYACVYTFDEAVDALKIWGIIP